MTRFHLAVASSFGLAGCSLVYNPNNIPVRTDASIDAAIDADPAMLLLTDVGPAEIFEGQGDGGSRPAIIAVHGTNFVAGAQLEITSQTPVLLDVDNTKLEVGAGADYLAVPVTAHVDRNIADNTLVPLTIRVTQPLPGGGTVMKELSGMLSLHGLDELEAPVTDWSKLKARYSVIALTGAINVNPGATSAPRVLRSTSSIAVAGLSARGGNASGTSGGTAGAGGCPGADGLGTGTCNGSGHGAVGMVVAGGGGGGAGFASPGTGGGGSAGGAGGSTVGQDAVADFATDLAAGGGGAAGALLNLQGGGGGGGAGTIELVADGDVTVTGTLDVTGGNSASSGGGGGAGAGGVIVVRAAGTLGGGGTLVAGPGTPAGNGGTASPGRIRWDAGNGTPPTQNPAAVRGEAFVLTTPLIVTSATAKLTLVGTPDHQFSVSAVDQLMLPHPGPQGVAVGGNSMVDTNVPWTPGFNHVCITLVEGTKGKLEADTCIDVAYLP